MNRLRTNSPRSVAKQLNIPWYVIYYMIETGLIKTIRTGKKDWLSYIPQEEIEYLQRAIDIRSRMEHPKGLTRVLRAVKDNN